MIAIGNGNLRGKKGSRCPQGTEWGGVSRVQLIGMQGRKSRNWELRERSATLCLFPLDSECLKGRGHPIYTHFLKVSCDTWHIVIIRMMMINYGPFVC